MDEYEYEPEMTSDQAEISETDSEPAETFSEPTDFSGEPAETEAPAEEPVPETEPRMEYAEPPVPPAGPEKKKEKKSHKGWGRRVAIVVLCVALSVASAFGASLITSRHYLKQAAASVQEEKVVKDVTTNVYSNMSAAKFTGKQMAARDIYDLACTQVIGITTTFSQRTMFGQEAQYTVSGSGFVISEDGYIMTNYHVIEYAVKYSSDINIVFYDGTSYVAQVVGYYADNDLAVLKIDAEGLSPVAFGSINDCRVGDDVYVVGNPLGNLEYTMTAGIISSLERCISTSTNVSINMFQIDAAVNEGNSGGPIYNSLGQVIGVVTAKYSSSGVEGLGFGIPVDDAIKIAEELIENGAITGKAQLGITCTSVSAMKNGEYDLNSGVYVNTVNSGSCAEKAGIRSGDVIVELNGTAIKNVEKLKSVLTRCRAGDEVTVTVIRGSETLNLTLVLDAKADT